MPARRQFDITETARVPRLSLVLGYGPMLPFVGGALIAWLTAARWHHALVLLTVIWAASILAFLAGVRRGVSFRTPGGPTVVQIATMVCFFTLASGSLVALVGGAAVVCVALLLAGFALTMVLDPIAATHAEAPLFFATLRPPQISIAVASLVALLVCVAVRGG